MWSPSQLVGLHVDHAAPGDGSGGGYLEVLWFEYEILFVAHLYDLTAHETELGGGGRRGKEMGNVGGRMKGRKRGGGRREGEGRWGMRRGRGRIYCM